MKVINFFSGPGSGKSHTATHLYLSINPYTKAELVHEFAKELTYGNKEQLVNQVYILGNQYRMMKDLERGGIQIAVADSPLLLQMVYCLDKPYFKEIEALAWKLTEEFENINVFVKRYHPYQTTGRIQTEAEAIAIDKLTIDYMDNNFQFTINGNNKGCKQITKEVMQIIQAN